MQLTQQIRIQTTPEQEQVLWDLSEKCRLIYNFALKARKDTFKNEHKSISYIDQQNQLPKIKNNILSTDGCTARYCSIHCELLTLISNRSSNYGRMDGKKHDHQSSKVNDSSRR